MKLVELVGLLCRLMSTIQLPDNVLLIQFKQTNEEVKQGIYVCVHRPS